MPIRVFKTPTKNSASKVHIGIPKSIQLDNSITSISISQVEILPPPKTLRQLSTVPLTIKNPPLNAFKNVQKSVLEPGYSIKAIPTGTMSTSTAALEIQEIEIPSSYTHLDDMSDWEIYSYNRSYFSTGPNFKPLPNEKNIPLKPVYNLIVNGRTFHAKYRKPIQSIRVYYRRVTKNSEDYEWIFWKELSTKSKNKLVNTFEGFGNYIFRAVPYIGNIPIGGYRDYKLFYEEDESLEWSAIQLEQDTFMIRLEGQLSEKINYVEIIEKGKRLFSRKLLVDKDGRVEASFKIKGISNEENPRLEYKFYRKNNSFKSFVVNYYHTLQKKYAAEPIDFLVKKISPSKFSINIQDKDNLLYSPESSINSFSSSSWNRAIQTNRLICKLRINRHQDGEVTPYGDYFINITQEKSPSFINVPPFGGNVRKVGNGFEFDFEDTQEFRQITNLDSPNMDKKLAYEFRLMFWSAGVEEALRSGEAYSFIKEASVFVKNKRRQYKFSYNTWVEEHPRKKYYGYIPKDIKYSYLEDHIRYGLSPIGFVYSSTKLPIERTRNIEIIPDVWKVLYYYNDKDDEIQEFPYYEFNINIPDNSLTEIEKLNVHVKNAIPFAKDVKIGEFHPSESINVLDFFGYYNTRESITRKIALEKTLSPLRNSILQDFQFGLSKKSPPAGASLSTAATRSSKRSLRIPFNVDSASKSKSYEVSRYLKGDNIEEGSQSSYSASQSTAVVPTTSFNIGKTKKIGGLPSMKVNTLEKKIIATKSNNSINNSISRKAEEGIVVYQVDIVYRDGKVVTKSLSVPLSERPKLPEEPQDNLSVSVGNKTFQESTVQLPQSAAATVAKSIARIPISTSSTVDSQRKIFKRAGKPVQSFGGFNK